MMAERLRKIFADQKMSDGQYEADWITKNLNRLLDRQIGAIYNLTDYSEAEGHNYRDMKIIDILVTEAMDRFDVPREVLIGHVKLWFTNCFTK